jgi:hypothetical protein
MTYHDLLTDAQANPDNADFHSLRMAYAHSQDYQPYIQDETNLQVLRTALHVGEHQRALDAIQALLDYCYLDIEAHMAADYVHHRTFAKGLIDAILATGDGQNYDTAFIAISVPEEYTLLRLMRLKPAGQALQQHQGHWFDVFDVDHAQTGEPRKLYFNIDLPRTWLERGLSGRSHGSDDAGDDE